jgi:hypothetical protein
MFRRRGQRKAARQAVKAAGKSLEEATAARREQERLRAREQESLLTRIDRLAAGNGLAQLALDALAESHGRHGRKSS